MKTKTQQHKDLERQHIDLSTLNKELEKVVKTMKLLEVVFIINAIVGIIKLVIV